MTGEQPGFASKREPIPVYIVPYVARDNGEISLIDLWKVLARRKWSTLGPLLSSVVLAVVYLLTAQPVYTAESRLVAPNVSDIRGLQLDFVNTEMYGLKALDVNTEMYGLKALDPSRVFNKFVRNFKSIALQQQFFAEKKLLRLYMGADTEDGVDAARIFQNRFNKDLTINVNKDAVATVRFGFRDPVEAASLLKNYVEFINERTVHELLSDLEAIVQVQSDRLQKQLDSQVKIAGQKRQDRITQYSEALQIANKLGIHAPTDIPSLTNVIGAVALDSQAEAPLYARGTDRLEAEIAALKSRKSDLPFIEDGYELQRQLLYLQSLSIYDKGMSAMRVDAATYPPDKPDTPDKLLILMLAAVLGLSLGIFLSFIAEFSNKVRQQT